MHENSFAKKVLSLFQVINQFIVTIDPQTCDQFVKKLHRWTILSRHPFEKYKNT